jgi:hypothetical protein
LRTSGGKPPDLITQARDGVVDLVWTVNGYTPALFPRSEVFELPFVHVDNLVATNLAMREMFDKHLATEYGGVKVMWLHVHAGQGFHMVDSRLRRLRLGVRLLARHRLDHGAGRDSGAAPLQLFAGARHRHAAAGGVLGILIPPSIVLVVYAIIVEANIVTMFAAALIPGLIAVLFFLITIAVYVRLWPELGPKGEAVSRRELLASTVAVVPVLCIFGLVIGGIYFGFFNPTPAAAAGVFLVALYGVVRGVVRWPQVRASLLATAQTTGMI